MTDIYLPKVGTRLQPRVEETEDQKAVRLFDQARQSLSDFLPLTTEGGPETTQDKASWLIKLLQNSFANGLAISGDDFEQLKIAIEVLGVEGTRQDVDKSIRAFEGAAQELRAAGHGGLVSNLSALIDSLKHVRDGQLIAMTADRWEDN